MDNGCVFRVDNDYEYEKRTYDFRMPKQYEKLTEKIKEGIEFYKCERDYRRILSEDTQKQIKQIEALMDDRCHRNFTINCEEDALRSYINTYAEGYPDNLKNVAQLMEFVKTRAEDGLLKKAVEKAEKLIDKG